MSNRRRITLVVRRVPTIRAVRAQHGPAHGGQRVTIVGSDFAVGRGNTTISFGRLSAIHVICPIDTRCTARTPPHAAGVVRVRVTVDGLSAASGGPVIRYHYRGRLGRARRLRVTR